MHRLRLSNTATPPVLIPAKETITAKHVANWMNYNPAPWAPSRLQTDSWRFWRFPSPWTCPRWRSGRERLTANTQTGPRAPRWTSAVRISRQFRAILRHRLDPVDVVGEKWFSWMCHGERLASWRAVQTVLWEVLLDLMTWLSVCCWAGQYASMESRTYLTHPPSRCG